MPIIQDIIPFPVDTPRRFNVCLMSHSRRIDVETTSYVYSVKVKQTIKDYKIFSNIETKHPLKIGNADTGGHNF